MKALKKISYPFRPEEFHYISPLPPEEFGKVVHALCARNPYIPHSSGLEGKEFGKAFEFSSIYTMRFRGTGDSHSAWLSGSYSVTAGKGTQVHFWVTPNPGYGMLALIFGAVGCIALILGSILYIRNDISSILGGSTFLIMVPVLALLAQYAKQSLKNDVVRHLGLKSAP